MGSILFVLFLLAPGLYDKAGTAVYVGIDHALPGPAINDYFEPVSRRTGQLTATNGLHVRCGLKEERRVIDAPQGRLGASLYYSGDAKRAAIILVHGSDAETREMGFLIPYFVCNGINVISYDQRGTGESVGNWFFTGPPLKADDVAAVYDAFSGDRRVDSKRIGAWGGSNGGWVVPIVTLRRPMAFMILKSAASESLLSNIDYEVKMEMIGDKQSSAAIAQALSMWHTVEAALYGKTPWDDADRVLRSDEKQPWFKDSLMPQFPVPIPQTTRDGFRRFITYDPSVTLSSTITPALVLFGAVDKRVDTPDSSAHMRSFLRSAGDHDVTIIMFPHADHYLEASSDGYHEYAPEHFVDGYPDIMLRWLRQRGLIR
jgi:uncharacterized protein